MPEIAGRLASISIVGAPVSLTAEATTSADLLTYQITNAAKRLLDKNTAVVIKVDGVTVSTGITINYVLGSVVFATEQGIEDVVIISGKYLPQTTAATAHDYTYNRTTDMGEITAFLATHKKRLPLEKYASGTLSQWDIADTYFADALAADTPVYLVLNDGGGNYNALLALLNQVELKAVTGGVQDQIVQFISANEEIS